MYLTTGLWPRSDNPTDEILEQMLTTLIFVTVDDDYVIYQLTEESEEPCSYMQARPEDETAYIVEYRDGEAKRHYAKHGLTVEETIALFKSYHRQDNQWRSAVDWRDISAGFKSLSGEETDAIT